MSAIARPVPTTTRISHRNHSSQSEFSNRLKHLQRSDPVNPAELTQRLNAILADVPNGVQTKRRGPNIGEINAEYARSASPSEPSTPRQNARQSTFDSAGLARSSTTSGPENDDDPMSRVANALKICRNSDPRQPPLSPKQRPDEQEKQRTESGAKSQNDLAKSSQDLASWPLRLAASPFTRIEDQAGSAPQSTNKKLGTDIAHAMKKRTSRKAPPPLILTVMPKAARAEVVDVASPITTTLTPALPSLAPLSPFGPNFTENSGTFLVYQPDELDLSALSSASNGLHSARSENGDPPGKFNVATTAVARSRKLSREEYTVLPTLREKCEGRLVGHVNEPSRKQVDAPNGVSSSGPEPITLRMGEETNNLPSIMLPQNREAQDVDERSERDVSPIFDISDAHSSTTSFGQPSTTGHSELKSMPSKRTGFAPKESADFGYDVAAPHTFSDPASSSKQSRPVSPLHQAIDINTTFNHDPDVSPLASPRSPTIPNRISSLPTAEQQDLNVNPFSLPRKPVDSGSFTVPIHEDLENRVYPPRPTRHDSTGFTVAREYIRESVDSEHVRLVHSAAYRDGDFGAAHPELVSKPQELPKLTTPGQKRGKWELIADGIALMDSDSPVVSRSNPKVPVFIHPGSRTLSDSDSFGAGPENPLHSPRADLRLQTQRRSPALESSQLAQGPQMDTTATPVTTLNRGMSRDRRATDAAITSLSSRRDQRARPLIQDDSHPSDVSGTTNRPRTAGHKVSQPTPMPALPNKIPTRIKFPPRANVAELGVMSPESLKLLHEQEALLRKRYDAVLNPIDDALKKKQSDSAPTSATTVPKKHNHTRSKSVDIAAAVLATSHVEIESALARQRDQTAREQAAIRMQRRNLGAAARQLGENDNDAYHTQMLVQQEHMFSGEPMGLPGGFPSPESKSATAFPVDDAMQEKRKRGKWMFWKTR